MSDFFKLSTEKYSNDKQISRKKFNTIIGFLLLYGFIMTFVITVLFAEAVANIPFLFLIIGYFICVIAGIIMIKKSYSPIKSFIAYNLIVLPLGILLALILPYYYLGTILMAMLLTGAITIVMVVFANIKPDWFISVSKILPWLLLCVIIAEIVMLIMGFYLTIFDFIVLAIFAMYIGIDWIRMNSMPTTLCAAFDAAAEIYIDLINIFIRLLRILSRSND